LLDEWLKRAAASRAERIARRELRRWLVPARRWGDF